MLPANDEGGQDGRTERGVGDRSEVFAKKSNT